MGLADVEVDVGLAVAVVHPAHKVVKVGVSGFGMHDRSHRLFVVEEVVNCGEPLQERGPVARLLHSTLVGVVLPTFTNEIVSADEPVHRVTNGGHFEDVTGAWRELRGGAVATRDDANGCAGACAQCPPFALDTFALQVIGREHLLDGRTSGFGHVDEVDVNGVRMVVCRVDAMRASLALRVARVARVAPFGARTPIVGGVRWHRERDESVHVVYNQFRQYLSYTIKSFW